MKHVERIANMISSEEESEELLRLLHRKGFLKKQKLLCLSQVREDAIGVASVDNYFFDLEGIHTPEDFRLAFRNFLNETSSCSISWEDEREFIEGYLTSSQDRTSEVALSPFGHITSFELLPESKPYANSGSQQKGARIRKILAPWKEQILQYWKGVMLARPFHGEPSGEMFRKMQSEEEARLLLLEEMEWNQP